jgi:hypothetical protein
MLPRSGDVIQVDGEASVQFGGGREIGFRLIRVHDWPTYDGWVWLDGYELNGCGEAVERRSIFVRIAGLHVLGAARDVRQKRPADQRAHNSARRVADSLRRSAPAASTVRR